MKWLRAVELEEERLARERGRGTGALPPGCQKLISSRSWRWERRSNQEPSVMPM
jgi:hypothetical protein